MTHQKLRHTDIRHRPEGLEAQCVNCREWVPLDLDHWKPGDGMARCKACIAVYHREWQRVKRADLAWAAGVREGRRIEYRANRTDRLAATAEWRKKNRARIREYMRGYRARIRAMAVVE